jgi:hypothetical protein
MKYLFFGIFIFITLNVVGANFTASVNKTTVAAGETFQLTFSVNASASGFKPPSFTDFQILSGPNQSTSMTIVNGSMSQSISYSYYLQSNKEGEFIIPSATINVEGKSLSSNTVKIIVVKGSATQQAQKPQAAPNNQQQSTSQTSSGDVFLRAVVDKTNVYQGEQLVVSFKLYTRKQVSGLEAEKLPALDGFWSKDIDIPNQISLSNEMVDGVNYNVGVIKKAVLFPQRSGTLEISPFEINVNVLEASKPRSWMEQFMGGNYKEVKYSLKSKAVQINVTPLPEPKPADFSGIVGNVSLKDKIDKTTLKTNDAINLSLTISGNGNLHLIESPKILFPSDFEVYDPKIKDNITTGNNGVSGSRTYDYLLIPRHPGDFEIPAVNLSYFDANKKKFVSLQTNPHTIHVEKGGDYDASAFTSTIQNKEDIKYIGSDIHFIKTTAFPLKKKSEDFYRSALFYFLLLIQLTVFTCFMAYLQIQIRDNSNLKLKRSKEASRMAKKHLSKAQLYLKENKHNEFYEEIFTALWGFVGDKLSIPVSHLNKEVVSENLQKRKVKEETIKKLMDTIQNCEFARFAPAGNNHQENIYNEAMDIIMKVSEEMIGRLEN